LWGNAAHALEYLARADSIPHRTEGEAELLECLPDRLSRVLDLGSGAGRLLGLVRLAHPEAEAVALDFSQTMLKELRERFGSDRRVSIVTHDLEQPLPQSLASSTPLFPALRFIMCPTHASARCTRKFTVC
jgi:trans-aconitate methyltransferase